MPGTHPQFIGQNSPDWANRQTAWAVIIEKVAAGDQNAMAQFYDETSQVVYSLALRVLGNPADAEEVTFDVYTQVWRTAGRYSADRGTTLAWLVNIARSRSIDHLRARTFRDRSNAAVEDLGTIRDLADTPERVTEIHQQRRRLNAALEQLPVDQRTCIELAYFAGLSHSELADRLREPLGTVKTRIRSGMLKLRNALGENA